MRRFCPILCAAAVVAATAAAQETATSDDSLQAWQTLQEEYQAAIEKFFQPWQEAQKEGKPYELDYSKHPNRQFAARFVKFAKEHAGTEGAASALVRIVSTGQDQAEKDWAIETLLRDHLDSKAMKTAIFFLTWQKPEALAMVAEKSPHPDVKGTALLSIGQLEKNKDPEAALRIFRDVKEKYGDQPYYRNQTLGAKADAEIFEVQNLSVGKPAPEIEGEDLAGKRFKLSDYRGKVIMLDFWGDW